MKVLDAVRTALQGIKVFRPEHEPQEQIHLECVSEKEILESIPVLPINSKELAQSFMVQNEGLVNEYIFRKIKIAILTRAPDLILFRLGESDFLVTIYEEDYVEQLEKLEAFYLRTEQYEKITVCRKLQTMFHVDNLIRG